MRAVEIIEKKRDGETLTAAEIQYFIQAYTENTLPDYQAAAFLMAVFLRGMNRQETSDLTTAMANSGETLDLGAILGYSVDKHSSGGVGDKTTLIVLPLVAACGISVAKMSGRGLGFSGGTVDKLESIAGFRADLSADEFIQLAQTNGMVLGGQSLALAPADGKFYALRDVTGTVPSLALIASSIMSKKIAAGANGIVLDVKTGRGAFMKTVDEARALAQLMVAIGEDAGRDVIAVLSDMNQPLGEAVGNALEVVEALEVLNGGGADDLREHCLAIAGYMLKLAGQGERWTDADARRQTLETHLRDGTALAKFRHLIEAQGGDILMIDDSSRLPTAAIIEPYFAPREGFITFVDALKIAQAAMLLGGGREKKEDAIDYAVGLRVRAKVGNHVDMGVPLAMIHANDAAKMAACRSLLDSAFEFADSAPPSLPLFYDVIESQRH